VAAGIGASMAGGKRGTGDTRPRQQGDWYPTPSEVTQVLMEMVQFEGNVYEPCCGDGALARVIEHYGHTVFGTDLYDRGYGLGHGKKFDILKMQELLAPNVITNPPFDIAAEIIDHVMGNLKPQKMALLLKASFWHAKTRSALFNRYRPSRIIPLTWRPDFMRLGRPTMEVAWCIWEKGFEGHPTYELGYKPEKAIVIPEPEFVLSRAA
jgi:hypothetical protein